MLHLSKELGRARLFVKRDGLLGVEKIKVVDLGADIADARWPR
jgi:hypothetical protein